MRVKQLQQYIPCWIREQIIAEEVFPMTPTFDLFPYRRWGKRRRPRCPGGVGKPGFQLVKFTSKLINLSTYLRVLVRLEASAVVHDGLTVPNLCCAERTPLGGAL